MQKKLQPLLRSLAVHRKHESECMTSCRMCSLFEDRLLESRRVDALDAADCFVLARSDHIVGVAALFTANDQVLRGGGGGAHLLPAAGRSVADN